MHLIACLENRFRCKSRREKARILSTSGAGQSLLPPARRAKAPLSPRRSLPRRAKARQRDGGRRSLGRRDGGTSAPTFYGRALTFSYFAGLALLSATSLRAQDNYEIQVYGSETVAPGRTMVELHSNFTVEGRKDTENGVLPTDHAFHETLEITRGFTPWFETGFYIFTCARSGEGWQWVGDHIRPRVRVPEEWHWPVGVSLSAEAGYQQRTFSEDTWSLELRPIIDKQWGPWYASLNPAFEESLHGRNSSRGFEFAPNVKLSYDFTKVITGGVEYYASLGPVMGLDTFGNQQHYIFPALDLNFSPKWEFNFGVGFGLNHSSDHLIVKLILGRRF